MAVKLSAPAWGVKEIPSLSGFIISAVKHMPLGLRYKAETIQAQPFRVGYDMKLCITATGKNIDANIDARFGRAPWLLTIETDTGAIIEAVVWAVAEARVWVATEDADNCYPYRLKILLDI